jgi:hypothetical protein
MSDSTNTGGRGPVKIFELSSTLKFRASADPNGLLRLEIRQPWAWEVVKTADLIAVATNALALAAVGEPIKGFKFTSDDRYVDPPQLVVRR